MTERVIESLEELTSIMGENAKTFQALCEPHFKKNTGRVVLNGDFIEIKRNFPFAGEKYSISKQTRIA
ncbi:hypothetical protein GIX45_28225 [Erwinia sp. CPCC 100877]|nr:hypothetical protein [Erwinia sp. CPCC 100877]